MNRQNNRASAFGFLAISMWIVGFFSAVFAQQQTAPATAEDFNISGIVALGSGKTDEAIRAFTRAVQLKPAFPDAYANRCSAYLKL